MEEIILNPDVSKFTTDLCDSFVDLLTSTQINGGDINPNYIELAVLKAAYENNVRVDYAQVANHMRHLLEDFLDELNK